MDPEPHAELATKTDKHVAKEIAAALHTPDRKERLARWSPEFLAGIGDHPDPDEPWSPSTE
jgi:hypothetical protein